MQAGRLNHKDEVISFKCELHKIQKAMEFVENSNLDQYSGHCGILN